MNEFFQRLKQRKLVQWAIAYVAAAFALLQGIDIVAQQFGWPEGVRRGITLALVVGFFVTLVLAWYHGERGAQRVTGTELLIVGLILAVGGAFLWRFATSRAPDKNASMIPNENRTPAPAPTVLEKSIAVLPFDNLSRDPDNAYFCEGVQDEILTRLAKVADLKVISRTSTQHFKGTPENLPDIAKQLGVANIARLNEQATSRYVAPYAVALVYLGLGQKEHALDELERAYQRGETNYLFRVKVDPMLDDVRGNPRFEALVEKIVSGMPR